MAKAGMKPFLKWVGGKSQLLDVILPLVPKKFECYGEIFLGGGALFLALGHKKAIINDVNTDIINVFNVIRDNKSELIKDLKNHIQLHSEDYYYKIRDDFNDCELSSIERASKFIYLNKTGFNGLFRVNSQGKNNVPFGKKKNITNSTLFEKTNIDRISNYLNEVDLNMKSIDYKLLEDCFNIGDFVFVDPPYDSDDDKSFDSYTKFTFGKQGQRDLADFLKKLDSKCVKWMLTNHDTELINELYKGYRKFVVPVNRAINSDASNRQNATSETIFINYEITTEQKDEFDRQLFYKELKTSSYVLNKYVSWSDIIQRLENYKFEINDLNLLFSKNKEEFDRNYDTLFENDHRRKCFELLPLLVAKRLKKSERFTYLINGGEVTTFNPQDKDNVYHFMTESGLAEHLFISSNPNLDVKMYLTGLEVGLTSNDKKNKSGAFMVEQVARILKDKGIDFKNEVSYNEILNQDLGDDKRFDFVFNYEGMTYCLECNFFNASGSKINSESKRFISLNDEFKKYKNITFLWVTDGEGLKKNRNMVDQAITEVKNIYNLVRFEKFIQSL